ncbi:MAG: VWA domain-containing protein [Verrucomicrobia bacterium]|nr:VWA domain-containing protein [Verrucomicrobiota bacterium]
MTFLLDLLRGFEFQHPPVLAGLLVLPLVAWWLGRRGPVPAVPFPSLKLLPVPGRRPRRLAGRLSLAVVLLSIALLIASMARPRVPKGNIPDPSKGIDIMLALDYSGSMTEKDFHLKGKRVSRAEALADVVEKFIAKRPSDRIGIIGFAKGPYLVSPLTLDHEWVVSALHQIVQSHGTAIGEAIVASVHFLRKASADRSKIIIIVSDGQNSAGRKPLEVAPFAKKEGVRIYSIIVGPERLTGSKLNAHDLLKVSKLTGGQLFQAGDTHALQSVYDMIDLLEKRRFVQKRYQSYHELHPWLTLAALGVVLGQIAAQAVRRRIP